MIVKLSAAHYEELENIRRITLEFTGSTYNMKVVTKDGTDIGIPLSPRYDEAIKQLQAVYDGFSNSE